MNINVNKEQILTGVLVVLILLSAFQTYQLKTLSSKITGTGTAASGETYEQMMERMHGSSSSGTPSASAPATSNPAGTGMVGGC